MSINKIDKYAVNSINPGLKRVLYILEKFDNPQDKIKVINVVGTNGKGSTSTLLSYSLNEAGMKVGRFMSPAVFSEDETISTLEGGMLTNIDKKSYEDILNDIVKVCEPLKEDEIGYPTTFEMETVMAYLFFYEQKCDVAVVEAGMGGRLDATNVVTNPILSVLAHISIEHTKFLGNTIEDIIYEKCGIMKEGSLAVSCDYTGEEEYKKALIANEAKKRKTEVIFANKDSFLKAHVKTSLKGKFQEEKGAVAWRALNALMANKDKYAPDFDNLNEEAIRRGFIRAKISGRFEIIKSRGYNYILDGAHNPQAMRGFMGALDQYKLESEAEVAGCDNAAVDAHDTLDAGFIGIMAVFKDKDIDGICREIGGRFKKIIALDSKGERGLKGEDLCHKLIANGISANSATSVKEALDMARKETFGNGEACAGNTGCNETCNTGCNETCNTPICIFGTFSILKEAIEMIKRDIFENIDGVIFDLDGTLIDSMWVWDKVDEDFFAKRGLELPDDYTDDIATMGMHETAEYTINRFNLNEKSEDVIAEWSEMAKENYHTKVMIKPYVKELLEKLKQKNIKLGVATASYEELYVECLRRNGVLDYFHSITGTKETVNGKNSSEIYLLEAEKMGVSPDRCMVCEDVYKCVEVAKDAGFVTVGVYDDSNREDYEKIKNKADMSIESFEELLVCLLD